MNRWDRLCYVGVDAKETAVLQGQIVADHYREHPEQLDPNGDGVVSYVLLEGETSHQDSLIRTEWSVKTILDEGVPLERLTGLVGVTINDEFPATANEIEFVINPRYTSLNVATLCGVSGSEFRQKVSCTSKVGQSGVQYSFNILAPSRDEEFTADVTINIYNSSSDVIYSVTVDDVRMASNTKTLISGNLFTSPSASVTVNTTWNTSIVGTW